MSVTQKDSGEVMNSTNDALDRSDQSLKQDYRCATILNYCSDVRIDVAVLTSGRLNS